MRPCRLRTGLAAASDGDDRAQGCARVGIDCEPKRDLIHPLADGNADGLAAPEGQPVAQERLLMLPGELERGRAVACIPVGDAELASELFRFRASGNGFDECHRRRYRCRDAGRCADPVVRDIAPVRNPLHGGMSLLQVADVGPVRGCPAAVEQAGGCQRQGARTDREDLGALPVLGRDPIQHELIVARLQGGNDDVVGTVRIALVEGARGRLGLDA